MNNDLKKRKSSSNEKIALFYMKLDNKKYYYSYSFLDNISNLYEKYILAEPKDARNILEEQINL